MRGGLRDPDSYAGALFRRACPCAEIEEHSAEHTHSPENEWVHLRQIGQNQLQQKHRGEFYLPVVLCAAADIARIPVIFE